MKHDRTIICSVFTMFVMLQTHQSWAEQTFSLADLEMRVNQSLATDKFRTHLSELENAAIAKETAVLGATEIEYETDVNKSGKPESKALFLNQPLQFNFNSDRLKESAALDARINSNALDQEIRATTIQLANSITEAAYLKKQIAMFTNAVGTLKDMAKMVAASRGQATAIAIEQVSDKLRHKEEELKALTAKFDRISRALAEFNIDSQTSIDIPDPSIEQILSNIESVPEVKQATLQAAAADAQASAEAGKFELSAGIGAQTNGAGSDASYLLRISAPLGQAFVNRREVNRRRLESHVLKDHASLAAAQSKQLFNKLFSELEHTKSLLASLRLSNQTAERLYALSKKGFSSGIVPFDDLNDAFDRLLEATSEENDMEKQYQTIKLEILGKSGGLK